MTDEESKRAHLFLVASLGIRFDKDVCIFCGELVTPNNFNWIRQVVFDGRTPTGLDRKKPGEKTLVYHTVCSLPLEH